MVLASDRATFFRERMYEEAITRARHTHFCTLDDAIAAIEQAGEHAIVVIRNFVRPSGFYSDMNYLKRGPLLTLPRYDRDTVGPTRLRQRMIQEAPLDKYVGYQFMSPDNRDANRVLLTYCLEAARRFTWSKRSPDPRERIKVSKLYHSKAESPLFGRTASVEVPSRSDPNRRYVFKIMGIPVAHSHQHEVWRRIASEGHTGGEKVNGRQSGCELKYYGELTFRRPKKISLWCPHEIMAYMAITERVHEERGYVILQPFALPSKKAVQFDTDLRTRVFVQEVKQDKRGRKKITHTSLRLWQREVLHWRHVLAHPDENIFYAKNMLAYDVW